MIIANLILNDALKAMVQSPLDRRTYYSTIQEALEDNPITHIDPSHPDYDPGNPYDTKRFIGQKMVIQNPPEGDSPCEYWFKDGIADADLVRYSYEWENGIAAEADRATAAETDLQGQVDTVNTAIDAEVMTDVELASDEDSVELTNSYRNLKTGLESQSAIAMPTVSETKAGAMDSAMFVAFAQYGIDISEIKAMLAGLSRKVIAVGLGASPTQQQLTDAFNAIYPGAINAGDEVINTDAGDAWIMGNSGTWINTTSDSLELATTASPGLAKHSTLDGCIGYYVAGVGQVNGWSDLKAAVAANTANIATAQTAINGKAPASQSLAEASNTDVTIATPAVPSNTTAFILQTIWAKIRSLANNFSKYFPLKQNLGEIDFNEAVNSGMYRIGGNLNAPTSSGTNWQVTVFATGDGGVIQLVSYYSSFIGPWIRVRRSNGDWNSWIDISSLAPNAQSLTDESGDGNNMDTPAATGTVGYMLQTIWHKMRNVVNNVAGVSARTSHIRKAIFSEQGGVYHRLASKYDNGAAWFFAQAVIDIFPANDANEYEVSHISLRIERGITPNSPLSVKWFSSNGISNADFYVQKESDNFIRLYAKNININTQVMIVYFLGSTYEDMADDYASIGSSLPSPGGTNGALPLAQATKLRGFQQGGDSTQLVRGDGSLMPLPQTVQQVFGTDSTPATPFLLIEWDATGYSSASINIKSAGFYPGNIAFLKILSNSTLIDFLVITILVLSADGNTNRSYNCNICAPGEVFVPLVFNIGLNSLMPLINRPVANGGSGL